MYYRVNWWKKNDYDLPERFTEDYLYDYCQRSGESMQYMLDEVVDSDDRDDYELLRYVLRPYKERVAQANVLITNGDERDYRNIVKALLGTEKLELRELIDLADITDMWYTAKVADLKSYGSSKLKITYEAWELVEDVIYERIDKLKDEVIKEVTKY